MKSKRRQAADSVHKQLRETYSKRTRLSIEIKHLTLSDLEISVIQEGIDRLDADIERLKQAYNTLVGGRPIPVTPEPTSKTKHAIILIAYIMFVLILINHFITK